MVKRSRKLGLDADRQHGNRPQVIHMQNETVTPELAIPDGWDSLSPVLQDNLLRQRREGGIKVRNIPILSDKVDNTLKPHTDTIAELKKQLAEVEVELDKAKLHKDLVKCRDARRALLNDIKLATDNKSKDRKVDADHIELTHFRAVARASEWMRMRQVTGILGELQYEQRQDTDAEEIAEFEHAQSVGKSVAQVIGVLDLSLYAQ